MYFVKNTNVQENVEFGLLNPADSFFWLTAGDYQAYNKGHNSKGAVGIGPAASFVFFKLFACRSGQSFYRGPGSADGKEDVQFYVGSDF